ncbi:hypothetical protein [Streptomyces sp. WAC05374]|nr:hypothetical protein [Streptomyces sp. WAC05374]
MRRGQVYTLRVTAAPAVHHQLLACCDVMDRAISALAAFFG